MKIKTPFENNLSVFLRNSIAQLVYDRFDGFYQSIDSFFIKARGQIKVQSYVSLNLQPFQIYSSSIVLDILWFWWDNAAVYR